MPIQDAVLYYGQLAGPDHGGPEEAGGGGQPRTQAQDQPDKPQQDTVLSYPVYMRAGWSC